MADTKFLYNDKATIGYYSSNMYPPRQFGLSLFATPYGFTVSSILLRLAKYGAPKGVFTVSLYETVLSGRYHVPTGSPLATASILHPDVTAYPYSIPWNPVGALYPFIFSTPPIILPTVTYVIMFSSSPCSSSAFVGLGASTLGIEGNGASAGQIYYSGVTWQSWPTSSTVFQLYGEVIIPRNPARPDADLPDFPADRPDDYAPDDFWIPGEWNDDVYTPPNWGPPTNERYFATGGGRWGQQLVAVGHGLVYYEELT